MILFLLINFHQLFSYNISDNITLVKFNTIDGIYKYKYIMIITQQSN